MSHAHKSESNYGYIFHEDDVVISLKILKIRRRWAKKRGRPRQFGHREGAKTFKKITKYAKELGIKYITFYAFSTENWKRPKDEVDAIMKLFEEYLDNVREHIKDNIRVLFIGDRTKLTSTLQGKMSKIENDSKDFSDMTLILAINYGVV